MCFRRYLMEKVFEYITLTLLSILKIRELIANNFEVPLPTKMKWLLYNKKDEKPVLCRKAYERAQRINDYANEKNIIERLLIMDGNHIKYYPDGYFHRKKFSTEINSHYFINTLEASYIEQDLCLMKMAILRLIKESEFKQEIDFILFLKNGNQTLAREVFKGDRDITYICKIDEHSSYFPANETDSIDKYSIQYENLDSLLARANNLVDSSSRLNGIVIDCSVSTGVGLKDSINHFNNLLEKNNTLRINKIEHVFVLYCHQNFDDSEEFFKLHRYFDMDEEIREMIYNDIMTSDNKGEGAKKVYNKLKEKNRIYFDL